MSSKQTNAAAAHPTGKAFRAHFKRFVAQAEAMGMTDTTAEALIGIDASLFAWRRRMIKGELVHNILDTLALGIEKAEFEALTALSRLNWGVSGTARSDVTIGDIAEELTIDPSRASRLVSALVNKGYIRRAVAQDDARKTVLQLTEASRALFDAFMALKWRLVFAAFKAWSERDIVDFERLFAHYLVAMDDAISNAGDEAPEAKNLTEKIRIAVESELASR
jgi:DNA-binding MarR family transcriptional regulator